MLLYTTHKKKKRNWTLAGFESVDLATRIRQKFGTVFASELTLTRKTKTTPTVFVWVSSKVLPKKYINFFTYAVWNTGKLYKWRRARCWALVLVLYGSGFGVGKGKSCRLTQTGRRIKNTYIYFGSKLPSTTGKHLRERSMRIWIECIAHTKFGTKLSLAKHWSTRSTRKWDTYST